VPGVLKRGNPVLAGEPPTRLRLTSAQELDENWPAAQAKRTFESRSVDGRRLITIDHEPRTGHRIWIPGMGRYLISPDGLNVLCAPPRARAGRWRVLIGQALPLASALRGFEVFHASAVASEGQAIAFVAPSGVGKTSLALQMVLAGAQLLADDVLALQAVEGEIVAHAGAGTANVPREQAAGMSAAELARLGEVIDKTHKLHLAFEADERPVPLSSIYFLKREAGLGHALIERLDPPDPAILLGSTYVSHVRTPRRLIAQLDVCSRIAQTGRLFTVRFDPSRGAPALRSAVQDHLACTR
jgi:hypothetical protein